ncbi:MAG: hypothetical protein AAF711_07125 [Planctomycetota bacterium]
MVVHMGIGLFHACQQARLNGLRAYTPLLAFFMVASLAVTNGPSCLAGEIFTESFETETATTEQTLRAYPYLSLSRPTEGIRVQDGVLTTRQSSRVMLSLPKLKPGPAVISLDIGASCDSRGSSVVVEVMETNMVFHPGWSSGGAFRVDGVFFNTDMGFIPAIGVMHHLTIRTDGAGHFDVELIDGENPDNVYKVSFENPNINGNEVRLQSGNRAMLFDNIRIEDVLPADPVLPPNNTPVDIPPRVPVIPGSEIPAKPASPVYDLPARPRDTSPGEAGTKSLQTSADQAADWSEVITSVLKIAGIVLGIVTVLIASILAVIITIDRNTA